MPIVTKVIQLKDIQGNLLLPHAYSASKDNNGNDIPNTYATITTVNTKANDSEVVHNTGTETITGAKTFSTTPIVGTLAQTSSSDAAASTSYVRTAISDEDALVVHKAGNEEITGAKTFNTSGNGSLSFISTIDTNVTPEAHEWYQPIFIYDPAGNDIEGYIEIGNYTEGYHSTNIVARQVVNETLYHSVIRACIDQSGVGWATAPTPSSATDNSDKIATTEWVRNHRCTTNATTTSTASVDAPAYVVQNYKSGTNWYRIWSDGWIEQGGASTAGIAADSSATITLHRAMKDTNYCLEVTSSNFTNTGHTGAYNLFTQTYKITTTQFTVGAKSDNGKIYRVPFHWYVCGY